MCGLELHKSEHLSLLFEAALNNGVLVLKSGKATLRFLPPLNISKDEMKKGFKRLDKAFKEVLKSL